MDMEPAGRCCMPRSCSGLLDDVQAIGSTSCLHSSINSWLCSATGVESRGVANSAFSSPSLLGSDGQVVKFLWIQWTHCRHQCVISPIVGTVENSQAQWAGWARNHGFSLTDVFSMKHRNPGVFLTYCSRFSVSLAAGFPALIAVLLLPDLAPLRRSPES